MKFNKLAKGVLAASALTVAGFAQADIIASSMLEVQNFRLLVNGTEKAPTSIQTWSLVNDASFNGNTAPQSSASALTNTGAGTAEADPLSACSGPDCNVFAENDFATNLTFGMGDFASSDSLVEVDQRTTVGGSPNPEFGTDAYSRADASMNSSASNELQNAGSNIVNTITSTINFTLADGSTDNSIFMSYSYLGRLAAEIAADMLTPTVDSVANATFGVNFTLNYDANGDGNFTNADGVFGGIGSSRYIDMVTFSTNEAKSANNQLGSSDNYNGNKTVTLSGLNSGKYQLLINHSSLANVKSVSEPGLLAMFSLGLLGLAGLARRRNS